MLRNRGPREQLLAGVGGTVALVGIIVDGALPIFSTGMAPFLLTAPVVAWADPFFAVPMGAFAFYHVGVTSPVMTWTSILWNRRWVNSEQSRFSFSGGSIRGIVLMVSVGVPPILLAVLGGVSTMLLGVTAAGLLGLGTSSLWLPQLEAALRHRRHAILEGFRDGWLSPYEWHW